VGGGGALRGGLGRQKDLMGFNLAALRVVGRAVREGEVARGVVGEEGVEGGEEGGGRRKRGFVDVA